MRLASRLETTVFAEISSPEASNTPVAFRPFTTMFLTSAPVRISPPCDLNEDPIAAETDPIPPLANPQEPTLPSTSPIA